MRALGVTERGRRGLRSCGYGRGDSLMPRNCRSRFGCQVAALAATFGLLGLAAAADGQQSASPRRIGIVLNASSPKQKDAQAFRQGLRDAGYSEGRDVVIEWRPAYGDYSRLPQLITDLVQSKVDVI